MTPFLSKSDFKVAQSCATKLHYRKQGYPSAIEANEYILMLADGGYMVGKMAQLLYESGIEILTDSGTDAAIQDTEKLLQQDNVVLFEPAIYINNKLVRVDILEKKGNIFKIIEVKSKSFDSIEYQEKKALGKKYFETSEWQEYIEDIAFQKFVLKEKYPDAKIESYLLLPDKSKTTPIEGLIDWFKLEKAEVLGKTRFRKVDVTFTGDIKALIKGHILEWVQVDTYTDSLQSQIKGNSTLYIQSLLNNKKIDTPINIACSKCEFTDNNTEIPISGYQECWGELADVKPHIFELAQLGNFNRSKERHIDNLIKQKKVKLNDIPTDLIQDKYNNRPFYQVTKKEEFLLKDFLEELKNVEYPIHFIDFETSQMAIPYHANMRPYGKVIFQWSCHTIDIPGAIPRHTEWINTEDKYPNFKFARALKDVLGDKGSIMIWSLYENTMLKEIFHAFESMQYEDVELKNWLINTIKFSKDETSRFIDMNNLTLKYYFHPRMGGRTSIKVTLPAVLKSTCSEIIKKYLLDIDLYQLDENKNLIDPYKLLPKLEMGDFLLDVSNGTDAMMAYQSMLYGIHKNNVESKKIYKRALLEYCRLDTLAMVIIWKHWEDLLKKN